VKADICKLPFESNIYDLVFCNHVLEHVPDDQKAMSELYRVLKKGGTLIAQVPIKEDRLKTFENWSITSPDERAKVFGQYDHVRIYGQDYYSRLEKVGFKTKAFDLISKLKPAEIIYFGLKKEKIPVAVKNH
jgi:ubiquinone/menaquinone biosynthesis C-methylase UbiE